VSEHFVLQFSTGELVAVTGTGLVGRAPSAEPGEFVDHLVPIADPTRSVSKTHLEFGDGDDVFWVSDRYSTNGTVAVGPDGERVRCHPGRRVLVDRGGRVEFGEQFFLLV
jgi:predicted component of type VI protein secretion system